MPGTVSEKLGYADDWAITYHQNAKQQTIEGAMEEDISAMREDFDTWYLRVNQTNSTLKIRVGDAWLPAHTGKSPS